MTYAILFLGGTVVGMVFVVVLLWVTGDTKGKKGKK